MSLRIRDPWSPATNKLQSTRRRIILAAEDVFATSSVERAKVADIAELAETSVGSIYLHFGSKDGLAIAYLDAVFDLLDEDLKALRSEPSPIQRVLGAGDIYIQHVIDYPVASRMATVRAAYPPDEHQGEFAEALDRRMVKTLMGVAEDLKSSMTAGEIPAAPIEEGMVFVWGAWHGVATMIARCDHLTLPPEIGLRALARGRRMLLAGLQLEPAGQTEQGMGQEGSIQAVDSSPVPPSGTVS